MRPTACRHRRGGGRAGRLLGTGPLQTITVNRLSTDAVVEAPGGAHFTSCPPDYGRDEAFQTGLRQVGRRRRGLGRLLARYLEVDEAATGRRRAKGRVSDGRADASGRAHPAECASVACAEAFRGDGEVLASPFGTIPALGARLARLTFEPDLVLTDGEAALMANTPPVSAGPKTPVLEAWMPYRRVFDVLWSGRRHVMMMATQVDRYGNQNISCIGDWARPKAQLIGVRGAPGNTINHTTSYWVPNHSTAQPSSSTSTWCAGSDTTGPPRPGRRPRASTRSGWWSRTSGCSTSRPPTIHAAALGPSGVSVDEVVAATGFALVVPRRRAHDTARPPTRSSHLIREVLDPGRMRRQGVAGVSQVPDAG